MKQLFILTIAAILFSGCSLFPSAWKSSRPAVPPKPEPQAEASPTQTVEELDAGVSQDLETSMEADLQQIDQDLKSIDAEAAGY